MKPWLCYFLLCSLLCSIPVLGTTAETNSPTATNAIPAESTNTVASPGPQIVYVIPVDNAIERTMVQTVEEGLAKAEEAGATAVILDMNTPGGRIDHTEKIITALLAAKVPTYTYVNSWAISAGAMIAFATDHIYMNHSGLIGDAMPMLVSPVPGQGVIALPDDVKEKLVSPTEAMIRRAAQQKGHDTELAACMVRRELSYKIGDEEVCKEGQILTLTSVDAVRLVGDDGEQRPLLAEGAVASLEEMLDMAGLADAKLVRTKVPASVAFARLLQQQFVSIIILGLGLLLIYIEFKIPGFGAPGVTGICLLALWFWAHHVVGLAGLTELLLLTLGVILLLLEIFVIPGFGIAGVAGIICICGALLMAMVDLFPATPPDVPRFVPLGWSIIGDALIHAVTTVGTAIVLSFVLMALVARYLPGTRVFRHIMLTTSLDGDKGCRASSPTSDIVGAKGTAASELRPAGIALIDGKRVNVVARGAFVAKGTAIVVAETHGNRIVVEVAPEPPAPDDNKEA